MNISDEGLRLIKSFEGYHKALSDGRCLAYRCPAGVLTIGWGCTEGVKEGMIWTKDEAEAALRREVAKFEEGVNRLVTAEINQNQFDALVSLAYNIGFGGKDKNGKTVPGFSTSTVLSLVNKGKFDKVPAAFALWNKGGGKVLPGLVSRRQREGALFMKPAAAPEEPIMPQQVTPSLPWWKLLLLRLGIGGSAVTGGAVATETVTPPDLSGATAWTGYGDTLLALGTWAVKHPVMTLIVLGTIAVLAFPKLIPERWRPV